MTCNRVDSLDERVRQLRVAADRLVEEHATVQEQVKILEAAVDGSNSPERESILTGELVSAPSTDNEQSEASDEDVAAAIKAAEDEADLEYGDDALIT